jgi:hypothetical protein
MEGLKRVLSPRSVDGCVGRHREKHCLCLPLYCGSAAQLGAAMGRGQCPQRQTRNPAWPVALPGRSARAVSSFFPLVGHILSSNYHHVFLSHLSNRQVFVRHLLPNLIFINLLYSCIAAFLYPGYASFKTLSQRPASEEDLERWLMYWSVLACVVGVEYLAEWLVSWCALRDSSSQQCRSPHYPLSLPM